MPEGASCLIIVPHDHPELHDRLKAHFSQRANIQVRLDARTGARATNELSVFAAGGGPLSPDLRADVEAEMRKVMSLAPQAVLRLKVDRSTDTPRPK
jgi:hypothetical protein